MKKTLLLFITLLTITLTNAQTQGDTFTVDNINYIVNEVTNTVSVAASASFPSTNLVIPATVASGGNSFDVTAIGNQSFRNNTDIQSVVIQAPITNIGNLTFSGCTSLQTVDLSAATSLTTLNIQLFDNCSSLTTVTLPNTVTTTAASPFRGCTSLSTINTENLTSIGNNAFLNCSALTSANFSELLTTGASALANTGFTGSLSFPKLTGLGNLSLQNCPATQIDIPVVETIGTGAFNGCAALTSITFPSTLTSLNQTNYNMFTGCTSLTNVIIQYTTFIPLEYNPNTTSANTSIFADVVANATLTIPSSVNAADYTGGDVWKDFNALTLNVDSKEAQLGWSFYPNPANDVVSIKNSQLKNADITVYDLNGRALLNKTVNSTQSEINISNLHTGIYLFNVKTDAGEFVKRIVKQ